MRGLGVLFLLIGAGLRAQSYGLKPGAVKLESAEALAFGPAGILFVGDQLGAAVVAIDVGAMGDRAVRDKADQAEDVELARINEKIAALLGTTADEIRIRDLKVNPVSKNVYLAVARGRGVDAISVLLRVKAGGEIGVVDLRNAPYARVALPGIPPRGPSRRRASRVMAITDMRYADGRLLIAGLSNEDFSSTLRTVTFPFTHADRGAAVEIYHVAHHNYETESPVRTMVPYESGGEQYVLAAYTCTPLVRLRVADLKDGAHVRGETLAELGRHSSPLDMVHYRRDGHDFLMVANTARGVLKLSLDKLEDYEAVDDTGGNARQIPMERIAWMKGVVQLDAYDGDRALVLFDILGRLDLRTVGLP